ncbi:MAG: hypothetical protein HY820_17125 [Acidobacteria bacterium]|nr:hypothetical protein [Acidobacteriota bacterium]
MSVEFVDTNLLVYAHDGGAGAKHTKAVELLERLFEEGVGALSTQVLAEFYASARRKLGMTTADAEAVIRDLGGWLIHRPSRPDHCPQPLPIGRARAAADDHHSTTPLAPLPRLRAML